MKNYPGNSLLIALLAVTVAVAQSAAQSEPKLERLTP